MFLENNLSEEKMKLNKDEMKRLATKSDAELWSEIKRIAKENGYTLPDIHPKGEDLERVRRALSGAEKMSIGEAGRILNEYKKKNKR